MIRFDSVAAIALCVQQLLKAVWSLTGVILLLRSYLVGSASAEFAAERESAVPPLCAATFCGRLHVLPSRCDQLSGEGM